MEAQASVTTNAFCFDSYNLDLCVQQHHDSLRELVIEIAAESVGASSTAWSSALRRQGSREHAKTSDLDRLPLSFAGRSNSFRNKRQRRGAEKEAQFYYANRTRACICVPPVGTSWWEGTSPCGRPGQQCGCSRNLTFGVGTVWEAWDVEIGAWAAAVIASDRHEMEAPACLEGASAEEEELRGERTAVDVAFLDGRVAQVLTAWLRPPASPILVADVEALGVAVWVCSCMTQARTLEDLEQ